MSLPGILLFLLLLITAWVLTWPKRKPLRKVVVLDPRWRGKGGDVDPRSIAAPRSPDYFVATLECGHAQYVTRPVTGARCPYC